MPAGLLWLGLLVVAVWSWRRKQGRLSGALFSLFLLYSFAGNRWVGMRLLGGLERSIPQETFATSEPFDAICVLGGGSELNGAFHPQLSEAGDRIALAARLWHSGKTRLLVASGTSDDDPTGTRDLGQETRELWLAMGVPPSAILVVSAPCRITREEVAEYRRLQSRLGWKRMALLSSTWHLPRVLALARKEGLEATPIGADEHYRNRRFQGVWLVPQGSGFHWVHLACWEYLGRWVGR
jgi:uncharacterized SAM-binding protein YcdF (DUF218 family)